MGGATSHLSDNKSEQHPAKRRRINEQYSNISDCYYSIDQVTDALTQAGLESSNLIVGIDFTKSNEWTGQRSFDGLSLHHIGESPNPYEQAISIIGQTLSKFDDDNLIPCFGFGDGSTQDRNVFSFYPDQRPSNGFTEVLSRYRELVPSVRLAGPTSFAPIIETAMSIVESSGGQYHVLLIIADGQVTRSINTNNGELSQQEQKTIEAIVKASELPLSIVLVGVGDGPWDTMHQFDDSISSRLFDNFQFVNFSEIMARDIPQSRKEATFALSALMEIPSQYKATIELGLLGRQNRISQRSIALPPPCSRSGITPTYIPATFTPSTSNSNNISNETAASTSIPPSIPATLTTPTSISNNKSNETAASTSTPPSIPATLTPPTRTSNNISDETLASTSTAPPLTSSDDDQYVCPICLVNRKGIAFGCGHQTCSSCSKKLTLCPICRCQIKTQIKLFY